ncbi:MAG: hypothetical protein HZB75_00355 [Candidatus Saccharibacteria bacterium]|nr:MAG: hypothetical protein HZB75_00355 [Candidatus Saccharibacteria bacterium]
MKKIKAWLRQPNRVLWFEYGALACIIILPLLLPGYILTLDLVFTPHSPFPSEITNTYFLQILLWALNAVLPGDVIEKIILLAVLLCSGVGMHLLIVKINKDSLDFWAVAAYFAGLLYMINPFVYSRFMAGQWMVLLGYAFVPFFVRALYDFYKTNSLRSAIVASLWAVAIITVSLHHIGIITLLGLFFAIAGYIKYRRTPDLRRFIKRSGLAVLLLVAATSFWLAPVIMGYGAVAQSVAGMDANHFAAFATGGAGVLGPIGEVVRLQGFWAEAQNLFVKPQAIVPGWGIIVVLLWILVVAGAVRAWRTHRAIAAFGMFCVVTGIVLSATPLIEWASGVLPLLGGYREPHKFASLIALGYAVLGAFGVVAFAKWATVKWGQAGNKMAMVGVLLLPIIITPVMFWGFGGQLAPRSYPTEWYELNADLKTEQSKTVLFLPWHQYSAYSFSGDRIIANPAAKFFENPTIISDDPEFKAISPTRPDQIKRQLSDLLGARDASGLRDFMNDQKISYIVLAKEQDWQSYGYIKDIPNLRLVKENDKLLLYKMENVND